MNVETKLKRPLTADEQAALSRYGADSTFLHATSQGRSGDFQHHPAFEEFSSRAAGERALLDSAIQISELLTDTTLFSAHGNGFAVRGSLVGLPQSFIGLTYQYPGFISTSASRDWAINFLEPRRFNGSRATLLEFQLPKGFAALDMKHGNHFGEFEFLLGRDTPFKIIDGVTMSDWLWKFVLSPY